MSRLDNGGSAMRVFRARTCQRFLFIIIASILFYILVEYEPANLPVLSFSAPSHEPIYESYPVYEYNSLYREKANVSFERSLDAKLVSLEREVRSKLSDKERDMVAKKRIWQVTTPELAEVWKSWTAQWRHNNEGWEHKLYTSPPADLLPLFTSIPEIAEANQTFPVVREDLTRYLILWYHGGFWTAIDTWERVAMRDCTPIVSVVDGERSVSLMLGVDVDEVYLSAKTMREWRWTRGFEFGQAVMWAPKRFDPMLRKAIVRTISHAMVQKDLPEQGWSQWSIGTFGSKIEYLSELSGADMFTSIVLEVLTGSLKEDHELRDRDAGLERRVTWKKFRHLTEILWIETNQTKENPDEDMRGLAVLPINVWGSGQNHSRSNSSESDDACVNHVHGWRLRMQRIFG